MGLRSGFGQCRDCDVLSTSSQPPDYLPFSTAHHSRGPFPGLRRDCGVLPESCMSLRSCPESLRSNGATVGSRSGSSGTCCSGSSYSSTSGRPSARGHNCLLGDCSMLEGVAARPCFDALVAVGSRVAVRATKQIGSLGHAKLIAAMQIDKARQFAEEMQSYDAIQTKSGWLSDSWR